MLREHANDFVVKGDNVGETTLRAVRGTPPSDLRGLGWDGVVPVIVHLDHSVASLRPHEFHCKIEAMLIRPETISKEDIDYIRNRYKLCFIYL